MDSKGYTDEMKVSIQIVEHSFNTKFVIINCTSAVSNL